VTEIVVKIVAPPIEPRLTKHVDFDQRDAEEWGGYAIKLDKWRTFCEVGAPSFGTYAVEVATAIAAPDGRVAVWYGRATTFGLAPGGKRTQRQDVTMYKAALAALDCKAAAAFWDDRRTRGGQRDVSALGLAACRLLHAAAFGYEPAFRDQLLAEFAPLQGTDRPSTAVLLRASDEALLAASALLAVENYKGACSLLMGRGVHSS